ncbi:DNA-binding transcriptional regulator, MarR family [Ruminococcus sp. YE71]|uniref:MarR family winged helix-turn-helix transcriptional regulator n=1 Tax=unclassified Ruminococcus TaxID=2608920 RepID=UPI00088F7C03|nr:MULTISPECIES: MarR family transcriptional regulator [unclassified Ruminococcus]SDA26141.1 DNA-binding transcriptional regulator, MarR family [Ruminococcus sp. YE78]SFW35918.1 DNA-binding transcriptional regulator, MarR family [Ruminococcus sp. YE71]
MDYDYRKAMKLDNQLCFPIYAAARVITSLYTPYLKPLGLTYTQYILFLVLWEKDGLTVGEICKRLMLDSGTLSPLLKKLRDQGYIEKQQSASDERSFIITLTDKGRELQLKAKDIPLQVGSCVSIAPEKALQLRDLLNELLENRSTDTKGE